MARRDSIALQSCRLKIKFQSKLQICTSGNKRLRRASFPRVPQSVAGWKGVCLSQPTLGMVSLLGGKRAWDRLDGQISYTKARFSRPQFVRDFDEKYGSPDFMLMQIAGPFFFSRLKSCTEALRSDSPLVSQLYGPTQH